MLGSTLLFVCCLARAQPSTSPRDDFWVPDGPVHAIVETNGILYIGGQFDYLSPVSATGVELDQVSGAHDPDFPKINGAVKAVLSDGRGGWFIGGLFTAVGEVAVTNLVHIRPDNTVDPAWSPNPDQVVLALAAAPDKLYVGGSFTRIGGLARTNLAAVDPATGTALPNWTADATTFSLKPGSVNALVLADTVLFVGGFFSYINGTLREHIASVDAATGAVNPWFPNVYSGGQAFARVDALAGSGDFLFVGGTFRAIGANVTNQPIRSFVAALDTTKNGTNSLTDWDPNASGPVTSLAVLCDTVYVGGSFTNIGGQPRNRIAALNRLTGQATSWDPNADGDVLSLAVSGNTAYAGGKFTFIGGAARNFLAALDLNTGQASLWSPKADFGVAGLALAGGTVVAGGVLGPGGVLRKNLAALDTRTGQPADWNPRASGATLVSGAPVEGVFALGYGSNTVYAGGYFTEIDAQPHTRLAAIEATTGRVESWAPAGANQRVRALAPADDRVYSGGNFTQIGGVSRNRIAALDPITGAASAWNPDANEEVDAMLASGSNVYVAGRFTRIGGANLGRLAALDAATGQASLWNPNANDQVLSLALAGNTLYFGGLFSTAGSQPRNRLAAADASTGIVNCWDPNPRLLTSAGERSAAVNALAASGSRVYVGGSFNAIGGQTRNNLAALGSACPGSADAWNPDVDAPVNALAVDGDTAYAGGAFKNIGGQYHPFLAVFPPVDSPRLTSQPKGQKATVGQNVLLTVVAEGQPPLAYQWQRGGVDLAGATNATLVISNAQVPDSGDYTAVVTNSLGLINSRPATLIVLQSVSIIIQPFSQTVSPGTNVSLTVVANGNPPPAYQWRRNGVNIPGAVFPTLTLTNVQPQDGGSYSVVLDNGTGAVSSEVAEVLVLSAVLPFTDNFADRVVTNSFSGMGSGNNAGATAEAGEPRHANKRGGKSLWMTWRAPADGIAIFSTHGSSFDTLLAVYTNNVLTNLTSVASDDDGGKFLTSQAIFNAVAGTDYQIAVDGFAGAAGNLVLSWRLEATTDEVPRILFPPESLSVTNGSDATLSVLAVGQPPLRYQWFHNCDALAGATNDTLLLTNVQAETVGLYFVQVSNPNRQIESERAVVEIGPVANFVSQDKLEDLLAETPAGSAPSDRPTPQSVAGRLKPHDFPTVVAGTLGTQILNNFGATTEAGEANHAGVIGGASRWFLLRVESAATLVVDTIGSDIDTVLAVYTGMDLLSLTLIASDDNGALDGIRSRVIFSAVAETDYLVAVDGVNGAEGTIQLNWALGMPPAISIQPTNQTVRAGGNVTLTVVATGLPPPGYQWYWNGVMIAGATNASLTLTNVQLDQAGVYSVVLNNALGQTSSADAVLTVDLFKFEALADARSAFTNGAFRLFLTGAGNQPVIIEASTNLSAWLPVYTNSSSPPSLEFVDPDSLNHGRRFYRAVQGP